MKNLIIGLALVVGLAACNPVKQVLRSPEKTLVVVDKYLQQYPITSDTIYQKVPGDSIITIEMHTDTVYSGQVYDDGVDRDSLFGVPIFNQDTAMIVLPPGNYPLHIVRDKTITKYLTRTVTKTDTVLKTIIDRTFQTALQRDLAAQGAAVNQWKSDYIGMKASRNKFRLWFWILVGALGAGGLFWAYLKVKKP